MQDLKKWMVGLDLSDLDKHLIKYTWEISRVFKPEEIIFTHVKTRSDIPDRFRSGEDTSRDDILKLIEADVNEVFKGEENVKCEVHEGTPYFDLWRETYLHHTDLFLIGEKNIESGRKIVPEKFVRKSFCSVLFVPHVTHKIEKIWVPVDFSDNSKMAIETAMAFKNFYPKSHVICHHVFETPSIDLVDADLRKEYVDHFREESIKQFNDFTSNIAGSENLELKLTPWLYADVSDHIKEDAEENLADIIVMSSGGKSRVTSLFLGSSSSELIKLEKKIPLLIMKQKINKINAWDILTNL